MVHDAVVHELVLPAFHWYELMLPLPAVAAALKVKLPPGQITSAGVLTGVLTVGVTFTYAVISESDDRYTML